VKEGKKFTITYSGIFGTGYNLDYLIEVANLFKGDKNVTFQIHGFGERENELRKKISEDKIVNLSLSTNYLPLERLVRLLNSCDLLFLPMNPMKAHEAGLPTKLLEYMAVGKPIVCSSEGEAANIVKRAKCGVVVSPHNPNDAVEAIRRLKEDKPLREELGRNGRLFAVRHFSLEQVGKKLEGVFKLVTDS
jgi:glycosyltransferase involved in cell wall biosynthesis